MSLRQVLVIGGGDVGSAVAHRLFQLGIRVLVSERHSSPHARRGMAFTDALFEGRASLAGVEASWQADIEGVKQCWREGKSIPVVTLPEELLTEQIPFDVVVEATMRRYQSPPDLRNLAALVIGLGPGYAPGRNCHLAIETQWGEHMGDVLHDRPTADRSGGPRALAGVTRERFAIATCTGTWRTRSQLGERVVAGQPLGEIAGQVVVAPIDGHLRGVARDGVEVPAGQRLIEVDPREEPQVFGLGERPWAVAEGVARALNLTRPPGDLSPLV
jgi:xanthine dehydrogenase accessory factor